MIIFYSEKDWELDLTGISLTLIEENDLFFDYFVKDYSLPFDTNADNFTAEDLRFLHLNNIDLSTARFKGKLLIDSVFSDAYLTIKSVQGKKIKGIIYFGKTTLPLLETQLADLPWPVVKTSNLRSHASNTITKSYPDTGYNFPMIIDDKFKDTTYYDKFEGVVNNYESNNFKSNNIQTVEGESVIFNRNIVTPYPYLMEILRVGFKSAGLLMNGDFLNDKINEKIIIDTGKYLEKYSSTSEEDFSFDFFNSQYVDPFTNKIYSEFTKNFNAAIIGTYKLNVFMNLPASIKIVSFTIVQNGNQLYSSTLNNINEELKITVADAGSTGLIVVKMIIEPVNLELTNFNQFHFETESDKLNVFPNSFTLAEVMPNMTFATLLNKMRKWLNVKTVISGNVARLDYVDEQLEETEFVDKTPFEIEDPLKEPNPIKIYRLQYTETDFMYVDVTGRVYNPEDYNAQEIETIPIDVKVMPIELFGTSVFTAKRYEDDPDFRILLYDGLKDSLPVAAESVYGRNLKLPEIYETRYKKWLRFLLKSITYTDDFECDTTETFKINEGQFKYNQKHIYEKITKRRVSESVWKYTIVSKTLV